MLIIGKCSLIQIPVNLPKKYYFQGKKQVQIHLTTSLNNIQVERVPYQNQPGLILDEKLNFTQHIVNAISEVNKGISIIKKFRYSLPQKSFITIYKAFLRPVTEYGDIIYDQPQNDFFSEKLESIQYKAALAITGAIQGTSSDKIYQELGLESLKSRRWCNVSV